MALVEELKQNNRKNPKNLKKIDEKDIINSQKGIESDFEVKKQPVSARVRAREIRERRIHVDDQNVIGIEKEDGWYYRRFNDTPGRIKKYLDHGYEIVEAPVRAGYKRTQDSSQMGASAVQDVGGGMQAYYMRIPMEIWLEDQERKRKDKVESERKIAPNSLKNSLKSSTDQKAFRDYDKKVPGKGVVKSSVSFNETDEIIS